MFDTVPWLRTLALVLGLGGGLACELGADPPSEPEPRPPKVRKLYAPGLEPEPAEGALTEEKEASAIDGQEDALKAALSGPSEQLEPEPEPTPRRRRRRRVVTEEPEPEEPEGPGSLSDGKFQAVIADWVGMKRCLARNANRFRRGGASGALKLSLTIRGDGTVTKSEVVDASNSIARALAPCVERGAKRLRFPSFAGISEHVEKTAKFVF